MININIDKIKTIDDIIIKLSQIDIQLSRNEINNLNIDFGHDYINISTLAILSNWIKLKINQNIKLNITCNALESNSANYASRMNFFELIGYEYNENFIRHSEKGRFLPIKMFNNYDCDLIKEIDKIFINKFNFEEEDPMLYMIDYSLNEIIENIDRHSESTNLSTIVVQSYPVKNSVYICIIDNGIGIPNALRKTTAYKEWNDEKCIKKSTEKSIRTEGTKDEGQGNGLHIMKNFIQACDGSFSIYSQNSCYKYNPIENIDFTETIQGKWHGTIIELNININKNVSINDLLELPNYEPFSPTIDDLFS